MNTTSKGDSFENRVFTILEKMLNNDELYVSRKRSRIFQKKGYFSKDRGSNIVFDISIESYNTGCSEYSHLIPIECKDYNSTVPVDDLEEFSAKIDQVGQHNTKGMIISNSGFQRGALNFARSKKIAVGRVKENEKIDWVLKRQEKESSGELLSAEESIFQVPFAAEDDELMFGNLPDLLLHLGVIDKWVPNDEFLSVPYRTIAEIDTEIAQLNIARCYDGTRLNINALCETVSTLYDVDFDLTADIPAVNNIPTLGMIRFDPLQIFVSCNIKDENRRRFTIVHEIGHLILHLMLLRILYGSRLDTATSLDMSAQPLTKMTARLEYQSNLFASQVLLPKYAIANYMAGHFRRNNIHTGFVFADDQLVNRLALIDLLTDISDKFGVSPEVARLRLKKINLLKDSTERSMYNALQGAGFSMSTLF